MVIIGGYETFAPRRIRVHPVSRLARHVNAGVPSKARTA